MKKLLYLIVLVSNIFALDLITIGTGPLNSLYFPTGGNICLMVNNDRVNGSHLRCLPEPSDGLKDNLKELQKGKIDIAIAQSDMVYQAYNGLGVFKNHPQKNLRVLMTLYVEPLNFVVTKSSKIKKLYNMEGKNINFGPKDSEVATLVNRLFDSSSLNRSKINISYLDDDQLEKQLKEKKLDGYFTLSNTSNVMLRHLAVKYDMDIINITEKNFPPLYNILNQFPYYVKTTIVANTYKGIDKRYSFGPKISIVTTSDLDDSVATEVVKVIVQNLQQFKNLNKAYVNMTKTNILKALGAPLHKAAKRYYKKEKLLEEY